MTLAHQRLHDNPEQHFQGVPRVLEWLLALGVCWLCFAGVWLAPASGATLVYPDHLMPVHPLAAVPLYLVYLVGNQGIIVADLLVAVALAGLALYGRVRPVRRYPFLWPCVAVLAVAALGAAVRASQPYGDPAWLRLWLDGEPMARGALIFLAVAAYPRLARLALGSALAGLTVVAVAGIVQHVQGCTRWYADLDGGWVSGLTLVEHARVQSLTSYVNLTGALMAGAAPLWFAITAQRPTQRRWMRWVCLAAGTCAMLALWYTGARGPIIAVQIAILALVWRLYPPARWHALAALLAFTLVSRWSQLLPSLSALEGPLSVAALLAGIGFAVVGWRRHWRWFPLAVALLFVGGTQTLDRYVLHVELADRSMLDAPRAALYTEVARLVPLHPWVGVGDGVLGQYIITHGGLKALKLNTLPANQRNAHNQPLQWAAAQGIPLALLYTALVVWVVVWLWRRPRDWPAAFPRAATLAIAAALLAFLLCSLAEAHLWRMEGNGFFWTLAGLGAALTAAPQPAPADPMAD